MSALDRPQILLSFCGGLGSAKDPQKITTPDLSYLLLAVSTVHQFLRNAHRFAGIVKALNATTMVEIITDTNVIDAHSGNNIVKVVD